MVLWAVRPESGDRLWRKEAASETNHCIVTYLFYQQSDTKSMVLIIVKMPNNGPDNCPKPIIYPYYVPYKPTTQLFV